MNDWNGVPETHWRVWGKAFAASPGQVKVSAACPVCGENGLRQYFGAAGRRGGAGYWAWCVECRIYEHGSSLVPEQWVAPDIDIQEYYLKPHPAGLAEAIEVWLEKPSTQKIMEDLFTQAHSLLGKRDYEACDVFLQEFDVTEHPPIVAVGLLRAAWAAKSKLPAWEGLLGRTQVRIQSLGGDSESLLLGIV